MCWAHSKRFLLMLCLALPPGYSRPVHAQTKAVHVERLGGVVLLDAPRELEQALLTALSPWGIRVRALVREKPGQTLPGAALQAGAMARELDADALVWLSDDADGSVLWVYELSNDTVVARPLPDRALDAALAAALALSVKTWLRTSRAIPETVVESEVSAHVPESDRSPLIAREPEPTRAPRDSDDAARLQIVLHGAGRRAAYEPNVTEARYGVELRYFPWQDPISATRFWLGLRADGGERQSFGNAAFEGTYSEVGAGASAGVSQRVVSLFSLGMHVNAALHRGALSGTLLSDGAAAKRQRVGAIICMGPEMELLLEPFGIIFQTALGAALRTQRYAADGVEVLETNRVWWRLGGAARLTVF